VVLTGIIAASKISGKEIGELLIHGDEGEIRLHP
jgi:hypothetical protein